MNLAKLFEMQKELDEHITREKGLEGRDLLPQKIFDGGLTGAFLEMNYFLLRCYMETGRDEKIEETLGFTKQEYLFRNAWFLYVAIGMVGFGFTPEQIEAAYLAKNKVNHQRQENEY